jgi:hypothetical protein
MRNTRLRWMSFLLLTIALAACSPGRDTTPSPTASPDFSLGTPTPPATGLRIGVMLHLSIGCYNPYATPGACPSQVYYDGPCVGARVTVRRTHSAETLAEQVTDAKGFATFLVAPGYYASTIAAPLSDTSCGQYLAKLTPNAFALPTTMETEVKATGITTEVQHWAAAT